MSAGGNLTRHARHHALAQIGAEGQARIGNATALLIGMGGIGCAAGAYLASSGVGRLLLCDFDTVDPTNLGRQFLYTPDDVGRPKVEVAAERLGAINPDIVIDTITQRMDDDRLSAAIGRSDIVLDGTDNFATRFQVNDACIAAQRCLVSGAAIRLEGQVAVFGPDYDSSPCYRCLYTDADESLENCAGNGVLSPVPGVIGTLMAVEALKYLAGIDSPRGALRLYDASRGDFRSVTIRKDPQCASCCRD